MIKEKELRILLEKIENNISCVKQGLEYHKHDSFNGEAMGTTVVTTSDEWDKPYLGSDRDKLDAIFGKKRVSKK